jgi:uncharacterized LabA/DUF88 family protein
METKANRIAVLVDGDNAQSKLLKPILEEVSKYGKVTIRRIYGDWTIPQMSSWKESLNDLSFSPIQKFSYTTGKNSTDSSLIIDAMDILHDSIVDGFCIVSSDSDYTGLAKRIREEGIFVMGIGEKKTPNAFVQSCEIFTFCENITTELEETEPETRNRNRPQRKHHNFPKVNRELINKAFEMSVNEGEETHVSSIGSNLRKIDPSFDPRAFGFRNLTLLIASLPSYKVINNEVGGLNHPLVRKK